MLKFLPEGSGSDLSIAIATVSKMIYRKSICIVISDFKTSKGWYELSLLAKKHDVIAIKIMDKIDSAIPVNGLLSIVDIETKQQGYFYGFYKRQTGMYKQFWENHHSNWIQECQKRGVSPLVINTDEDPVKALMHFFRRRQFDLR